MQIINGSRLLVFLVAFASSHMHPRLAAAAQPYFAKIDLNAISNVKHENCSYSCCPGFSAGASYPMGEQTYDGVPFQHGRPESYAFSSIYACSMAGTPLQATATIPGDGRIHMLLSSWNGCAGGPDFILTALFSDASVKTWRLVNQVDYRDHNGSCMLSGSRTKQVWSNGAGQHLDLLSIPIEAPGRLLIAIKLESTQPLADTAPLVYGLTLASSADCNSDGIADYGQILTGQLDDDNANGIPDICETSVTGVIPPSVPAQGGATVTIKGVNFPESPTVLIGGAPATNVVRTSPTRITATSPALIPGMTSISVSGFTLPDALYIRPECGSDLDQNGEVDTADISIILLDFGPCYQAPVAAPTKGPLPPALPDAPTPTSDAPQTR